MKRYISILVILSFFVLFQCEKKSSFNEFQFEVKQISMNANNWWARAFADINSDGKLDIVLQDNNAYGGWLGWLEYPSHDSVWKQHIVCDSMKIGGTFAAGDIEVADVDSDGDIDIFGMLHGGEWESSGPSSIYWFENPDWKTHYIGEAPSCVKDIEKADFNKDGKIDIAVITYEANSFQVFAQTESGWFEAVNKRIKNIHEGMSVGDIDGDGFIDIATNGYWIKGPGTNLSDEWKVQSIDETWYNQDGDWSKNATKQFCADIDGDGMMEVFISHSERKGYPLSWYNLEDPFNNVWTEHVIDTIDGCHTLQVYDFDADGDLDVFAGENTMRWWEDDSYDPVNIYLNSGDNVTFDKKMITSEGIYNGLVGDVDGDGDYDFMRLPGHSAKVLELWENRQF